jgi:hypothetical protein
LVPFSKFSFQPLSYIAKISLDTRFKAKTSLFLTVGE